MNAYGFLSNPFEEIYKSFSNSKEQWAKDLKKRAYEALHSEDGPYKRVVQEEASSSRGRGS